MTLDFSNIADRSFDRHVPVPRPEIVMRAYGTEAVAWSPVASAPVHLDDVTHLVWQLIDGDVSVAELVDDVHDVLGVPEGIVRRQIGRALQVMQLGALLDDADLSAPPGDDSLFFSHPPNP